MKTIKAVAGRAFVILVIFSVVCGIVYPLLITAVSQLAFHDKANGSIIEAGKVKYASELLGQPFTGDHYMWGRVMNPDTETFTDENGDKTVYGSPSNLSPASEEYEVEIRKRAEKIKADNPDAKEEKVPVDLVTCSGSGLDPHISEAAAKYQIPRIAMERGMTQEDVQKIVERYTTGRFLGIFGEKTVNVVEVNLALDGIL